MTTFSEARAFLLRHRTDYDAAVKGIHGRIPCVQLGAGLVDAELVGKSCRVTRPRSGLSMPNGWRDQVHLHGIVAPD